MRGIVLLCLGVGALPAQGQFVRLQREAMPRDDANAQQASVVDLDGDGDLDVTINPAAHYRNDGRARFTLDVAFGSLGVTGRHVAGDADGDGDLDLVFAGAVVENRGAIGPLVHPTGLPGSPLAFVDLDGDLDGDVLTLDNGALAAWRAVAPFVFAPMPTPAVAAAVSGVAAADLDGDGDLDLVVAASPIGIPWLPPYVPGPEQVWRNDGAAGLTDVTATWLPGATDDVTLDVLATDLDGDGDADVACLSLGFTTGPLAWVFRRNQGNGVLVPWTGAGPPALPPVAFDALDLDRDGDADLVRDDLWFENVGGGGFTVHTIASPNVPLLAAGDLDGDLDLDLVLGGQGPAGRGLRVLLDQGGSQFVDATAMPWQPIPGPWPSAITGDVDGDGDLDLLQRGGPLQRNQGDGWFERQPFPWAATAQFTFDTFFTDVDADGDLDVVHLVAPPPGPAELRIAWNVGGGVFVDLAPAVPPLPLPGYGIGALFDVDGDGLPDFVLSTGTAALAWRNAGGGVFAPLPGAFPPLAVQTSTLTPADFDADGDVDLLLGAASYVTGPNLLALVNGGTGTFALDPTRVVFTGPVIVQSAHAFDADSDGDVDVFVGNLVGGSTTARHLLLRNNGAGTLVQDSAAIPPALAHGPAAVGDVDGDGAVDAVVTIATAGLHWWRNGGTGVFQPAGAIPVVDWTAGAPGLADVDGDGDADLLRGVELWTNRQWHVEAPFLPQVGCGYELRAGGRALPNAIALPFLGARAHLPLPPLGTIGVDPATALLLPAFPLTGQSGTFTAAIPNAPVLVGLPFSLQVVLVGAGGLHLTPPKHETIRS